MDQEREWKYGVMVGVRFYGQDSQVEAQVAKIQREMELMFGAERVEVKLQWVTTEPNKSLDSR